MKFLKKESASARKMEIAHVGTVHLVKSNRAKHLNIRIKPDAAVRVSVPKRMSFAQAERLVLTKTAWIRKHVQRLQKLAKEPVIFDGSKPVYTRLHKLDVKAAKVGRIAIALHEGVIRVRYPAEYNLTDRCIQEAIEQGLIAAYRQEAKAYLPERVTFLAGKHGFKYNKVFIKNHKSRWGSCSAKNNINLSLHLMRLTDELIDYVVLHELVHTRIKNHGPEFWRVLEQVCPGARELNRQLRKSVDVRWI